MRNKALRITFLLTFVIVLFTYGQQIKQRIAVIPFSAINIPESNAQTVTGLFETALVKTGAYTVFEQNQIAAIFESQKISLSGITDKKYAVELGKLLAAEQIILGELSSIGGKYILNVKIIDVELGRNIKADSVETAQLSEMSAAAELLAFKLTGLTYTTGQSVQIVNAFRDVFIETDPAGADIFINGVKKGISPGLFEQVPLGNIIIEAKKDNLYGRTETRITDNTNSLNIRLRETYGNLLIKSSVKEVDVYLDGLLNGKLDLGFFTDITVGEHIIILDGYGYYWEGSVSIIANKTVTVEAEPKPYGVLQYTIQDGVVGELSDISGTIQKLTLNGDITLSSGEYTVKLSGDDYKTEEFSIVINRNAKYIFDSVLKYNQEYITRKNRQDKVVRLEEIRLRRNEIEDEIIRLNRLASNKKLGGWISAGTSVLSAGLFGLFSVISNSAYDDYAAATISADAVEYKEKVQLLDTLSYISLGTSAAGAGLSAYLFMSKSPIEELNGEYVFLGIEMARLEGELQ